MKQRSRTANSLLNLITSVIQQGVYTILKFGVRTVFIRTLGAEYLGINGLFADVLTMLSLAELGIDTAINFKLYKPLTEGNVPRVRLYLKFYKQVYRAISVVIVLVGLLLIPALPYIIKDYHTLAELRVNAVFIYLLYLSQSAISYLFFAYRSVIIKADQKMYLLNVASFLITVVTSVLQICLLVTTKSFVLYTVFIMVIQVFTNCVYARIATKRYPEYFVKESNSLSKSEVVELFKDCGALFVFKVDNVVLKATDSIILSSFVGLTAVGLYSNYLLFYNTIKGLLSRIYVSTKASMGSLFATESNERKYELFEAMNLLTCMLYGTGAVGISVVANELISCWIGEKLVLPQPIPVLIGIELVLAGIKLNLGQIRSVSGVYRQMWYRPVFGVIINLVVSIVTVRFWGIAGVLVGTICAAVFSNFLFDPVLIHKYTFQNSHPVTEYYKNSICYFVLLLVVGAFDMWLCSFFFVGYGWVSVAVHTIICAISVPAAFLIVFNKKPAGRYWMTKVKQLTVAVKKH